MPPPSTLHAACHAFRYSAAGAVGTVAAFLTTLSLLPQLARIWSLKSARDISLGMFLLFSTGVFLWLIYGVLIHSLPVEVANAISFVFALAILVLKLVYDRKEKHGANGVEEEHEP